MNPRAFDLYLRSIATALISLAIVAAAVYDVLVLHEQDSFLIGSGGIVIGFYFGAHVTLNGQAARQRASDLAAAPASSAPPAE